VQRYDKCVSVTEKQKADCEYLVFGPKVLTAVAILMMATARVGLKSGTLNLYFSTQKPDFFAQYAAHAFETAANRRGLGTAIMRYATKMLQQRASAIPDDDTENEDTATGPASQLEKPPPPSSVDNGQGGMGPTPAKDSRGGGEGTSGEGAEGEGGAAASGLGQTPKPLVAAPTKPAPVTASAKGPKRFGSSNEIMSQHFHIWKDKQTIQGSCQFCIWKDKQNQGKSFVLDSKTRYAKCIFLQNSWFDFFQTYTSRRVTNLCIFLYMKS